MKQIHFIRLHNLFTRAEMLKSHFRTFHNSERFTTYVPAFDFAEL